MIKLFFPVILLIISSITAAAQIVLQPPSHSGGLIQKSQLWNVLIINSSNNQYTQCKLNLLLRDRQTGQEVFSASSSEFTIGPGAKQLGVSILNPIQYNYLTASINSDVQAFVPAGEYTACYSLSGTLGKNFDLAEECMQLEATPLSPPMLIFPADSSLLEVAPAQFSWTPPTPAAMFEKLQYDVVFAEINEGQKPSEAIQQNLPFYNDGNVSGNVLNYPGTVSAFEKGKWYAWQVVARDDRSYAGKSEVWVFSFGRENDQNSEKDSYAKLSSTYTGRIYYFGSFVNISFNNPYVKTHIDYKITRVKDNKKLGKLPKLFMEPGLNTLSIDIADIKGLKKNEQYVLSIHNLGSATQYLNFIIK